MTVRTVLKSLIDDPWPYPPVPTPEDLLNTAECRRRMLLELSYLKPRDAYLIKQKFYHGRTYTSLAKEYQCTRQCLQQTTAKALRQIWKRAHFAQLLDGLPTLDTLFDYWEEGLLAGYPLLPLDDNWKPAKQKISSRSSKPSKLPTNLTKAQQRLKQARRLVRGDLRLTYEDLIANHRVWVTRRWFEQQKAANLSGLRKRFHIPGT